ncbi:MAG: ABC transporter permease [Bacteroidales bacterium]|nr:ABC transporter permease [Bacteroidales bacterium]
MNTNRYIAQRLLPRNGRRFSKPILWIATISVGLGVCVMIWAFAITSGFRKEIREKVVGFGSHIVIQRFDNNQSYEKQPFSTHSLPLSKIERLPNVRCVQKCASKAGIIQTNEEIEGILFKGIDSNYDSSFFTRHLIRGHFPNYAHESETNDILISSHLANRLQLDTGEKIRVYFIQNPVRQRSFNIAGIYNTGLGNYDQTYALCAIRHIQKLNNWTEDSVDAIEILLHDFDKMENTCSRINHALPYQLTAETTKKMHPDMFEWIALFDQNVIVLVILITIVVCITLISTLLTITLEQIPAIGMLQTLGCTTKDIRNIFLFISRRILLKGMLIGNAAAMLFCMMQQKTHMLRLDPKNYFMDYVPMLCQWQHILGINLSVFAVGICFLLIPSHFVTKQIRIVDALDTK